MVAIQLSPGDNAAILLGLVALVFVPIGYIYPSRTPRWQLATVALGVLWTIAMAAIIWQLPDAPRWLVMPRCLPRLLLRALVRLALPANARPRARGSRARPRGLHASRTPPSASDAPRASPTLRRGSPTCPRDTQSARRRSGGRPQVQAERLGAGCGDLIREGVGRIGHMPAARPVGADCGQPCFLRAVDFVAVRAPVLRRAAAAVVDGDENGGVVAVLRVGLQPAPQLLEPRVGAPSVCSTRS